MPSMGITVGFMYGSEGRNPVNGLEIQVIMADVIGSNPVAEAIATRLKDYSGWLDQIVAALLQLKSNDWLRDGEVAPTPFQLRTLLGLYRSEADEIGSATLFRTGLMFWGHEVLARFERCDLNIELV
jgi:hypothetical protein